MEQATTDGDIDTVLADLHRVLDDNARALAKPKLLEQQLLKEEREQQEHEHQSHADDASDGAPPPPELFNESAVAEELPATAPLSKR